ncbi:MAG: hypothetical protein LBD64_05715 [Odoribacteraceae bacterium]|jgi:hypothetical protein|nr:hypothetical protein [Odoribacteraceae bacterium]
MEQLFKWVASGKCDEKALEYLEALVEEYPYFFVPRLLCLKKTFDADRTSYPEKLRQHSVHVPDFKLLYRYLHRLPPFEEGMTGAPDREVLKPRENLVHVSVYQLEKEYPEEVGETCPGKKEDPIDIFIREQPGMPRTPVATVEKGNMNEPPREDKEEFFTETLAKIYLKQKLYDKAIAVYMNLSLKYPEKSISFARSIEEINELKRNTK